MRLAVVEFIQTESFQRESDRLLSQNELLEIEARLLENPVLGTVIPGSGGMRKFRMKFRGRGARGGLRIVYFILDESAIILVAIYLKSEKTDVDHHQLKLAASENRRMKRQKRNRK